MEKLQKQEGQLLFLQKVFKKMGRFILFLILSVIIFSKDIFAQSPTEHSLPTSEGQDKINDKVDELKNKIASRVAQLNLVEKRGIIGVVENVSDIQITINDLNNKRRIIDVDEFTKFSLSEKDSGISDIKKGAKISVLGLYNKESQRLLARFVNEVSIPLFLEGVISQKDKENFTINLATEDDTSYTVDIEKITKTFEYSKGELEESGFSKLETFQNSFVIGYTDPKERTRITASKIIIFPGLPKNPKIKIVEEQSISPVPTKK